ncbi:DEAD/DEAH box helicase [bacterium]|nr:DEAD/DEAH box helicase [bacterium]
MSLNDFIADLRRDPQFMTNVTAWQTLSPRPAKMGDIPTALNLTLAAGLRRRNIGQLYSHQCHAVDAALAGDNVAVVTPTASGKTLCYNLPVLHDLLSDPDATALYLFPTKALAHDQLEELGEWQHTLSDLDPQLPPITFAAYDGDTPTSQRAQLRRHARIIVTNPDMLHVGILPYHAAWAEFFAGLRAVVIDEMHIYRGVFGSHMANVQRRLQRIAAFYGSKPRFVLTSATIANPGQLAEALIEAPVTVIDENGAPQGEKHIVLYNPPLYDPARGLRRSSVLESQEIVTRMLLGGVQSIVFSRSRLTVEVLLTYLRQRMTRLHHERDQRYQRREPWQNDPNHALRGYRGGYLPEERRAIEAGLRNGDVRAVVTTNALELGIDIGRLEAVLICGYPGTIAGTWQQMGRAGRTADASLAVLVATAGALDQYMVSHPEYLLERSPEHAFINPDNLMLLVDQIRCAAFELPFQRGESFGASAHTEDVLALLAEQGDLRHAQGRYLWQGESYPARQIGLRNSGSDIVVIQHQTPNGQARLIGEMDVGSATRLVHAGAVYIHEGQSYIVDNLDLDGRLASVTPQSVDFYTDANLHVEIEILATHDQAEAGGAHVGHGDVSVTWQVTDYRRVRHYTHETLGIYPLDYPPQTLETTGYWIEVTAAAQDALMRANQWHDSPNDYGPNWQEQRQKVRQRDGFCCTECGLPEPHHTQHDVHHLRPFRTFGYVPGLNENYKEANRLGNLVLLCKRCHRRVEAGVRTRSGLDGLAYALENLAPLFLMCDRADIGVSVMRSEEVTDDIAAPTNPSHRTVQAIPRVYIYESVAAGLGFSRQLFERHSDLLAAAASLIESCGCHYGCPACVGPVPVSGDSDIPLLNTKALALALVHVLQGRAETPIPARAVHDEVEF